MWSLNGIEVNNYSHLVKAGAWIQHIFQNYLVLFDRLVRAISAFLHPAFPDIETTPSATTCMPPYTRRARIFSLCSSVIKDVNALSS
jgi:hypothetical protein